MFKIKLLIVFILFLDVVFLTFVLFSVIFDYFFYYFINNKSYCYAYYRFYNHSYINRELIKQYHLFHPLYLSKFIISSNLFKSFVFVKVISNLFFFIFTFVPNFSFKVSSKSTYSLFFS